MRSVYTCKPECSAIIVRICNRISGYKTAVEKVRLRRQPLQFEQCWTEQGVVGYWTIVPKSEHEDIEIVMGGGFAPHLAEEIISAIRGFMRRLASDLPK
jgi:hypothetical protein